MLNQLKHVPSANSNYVFYCLYVYEELYYTLLGFDLTLSQTSVNF